MATKQVILTNESDHGFNQAEATMDQFRRKLMGDAARWELTATTDTETGAAQLILEIAKPEPAKAE